MIKVKEIEINFNPLEVYNVFKDKIDLEKTISYIPF